MHLAFMDGDETRYNGSRTPPFRIKFAEDQDGTSKAGLDNVVAPNASVNLKK